MSARRNRGNSSPENLFAIGPNTIILDGTIGGLALIGMMEEGKADVRCSANPQHKAVAVVVTPSGSRFQPWGRIQAFCEDDVEAGMYKDARLALDLSPNERWSDKVGRVPALHPGFGPIALRGFAADVEVREGIRLVHDSLREPQVHDEHQAA